MGGTYSCFQSPRLAACQRKGPSSSYHTRAKWCRKPGRQKTSPGANTREGAGARKQHCPSQQHHQASCAQPSQVFRSQVASHDSRVPVLGLVNTG